MANFKLHQKPGSIFPALIAGIALLTAWPSTAGAQQMVNGFVLERFYPSAPGGGWFVMDDLSMSGGLGGAVSLTGGYAQNPLTVTSPDGKQRLALVSQESFVDLGLAFTYDRYRVYLNLPVPLELAGTSGILGSYQFTAPSVNVGKNPDTISDTRLGFDARLLGKPGSALRLGLGAQLLFPSGARADYVTDARYRAMFRFLAAGDARGFAYACQIGVHIRPLNDFPAPGSPVGNELLFGISAGRKIGLGSQWKAIVGPEIFGETAFHSFPGGQTGTEGLLTARLERTGARSNLRIRLGVGHGIIQSFGAPEWRVLVGIEVFGQRPKS
jgi:hypothetical protein